MLFFLYLNVSLQYFAQRNSDTAEVCEMQNSNIALSLFAERQSLSLKSSSCGSLKWRREAFDLFVSLARACGMDVLGGNDKSAKILLAEPAFAS